MSLEALVFPQHPFGYGTQDLFFSMGVEANSCWGYENHHEKWDTSSPSLVKERHPISSPEPCTVDHVLTPNTTTRRRPKNRRAKNKQQVENQRMTHIAVERNRRKQMNQYLAALRSVMPQSYVQRGDQASIVGGAINFVKELEQQVQHMEAQKRHQADHPFADFFSFPQYTRRPTQKTNSSPSSSSSSSTADIEVSMADTHAHIKIVTKKKPRQLVKMVAAFQSLKLSLLHLNVTTTQPHMVLYSISLKVEEGSEMNTVDEIAAAVNEMLWRIELEASSYVIS